MKKIIDISSAYKSLSFDNIVAFLLSFLTIILISLFLAFISARYSLSIPQIVTLISGATILLFKVINFYKTLARKLVYLKFAKKRMILADLEKELNSILSLDTFSSLVTKSLMEAINSKDIAILIKKLKTNNFQIQNVTGFEKRNIESVVSQNSFLSFIRRIEKPLTLYGGLEILDQMGEENKKNIERKLRESKVEVLMPLFFEKKQIGLILLGGKKSPESVF
ncbi:MAG: hypothetical protein GF370_03850 [Candidatus Nealsonbacteria bacterium]|nr:hypothetical protein [Candidatus Nealsonbacteria bacterium]